jgi:hypothetical protein
MAQSNYDRNRYWRRPDEDAWARDRDWDRGPDWDRGRMGYQGGYRDDWERGRPGYGSERGYGMGREGGMPGGRGGYGGYWGEEYGGGGPRGYKGGRGGWDEEPSRGAHDRGYQGMRGMASEEHHGGMGRERGSYAEPYGGEYDRMGGWERGREWGRGAGWERGGSYGGGYGERGLQGEYGGPRGSVSAEPGGQRGGGFQMQFGPEGNRWSSTGGRWPERETFAGRGPRGYQRSDDRIREDVSERLTQHPEIDATEIEVAVESGEVILRGMVDDRWAKRMAEDAVEGVSGVKDVRNELRVSRYRGMGMSQGGMHGGGMPEGTSTQGGQTQASGMHSSGSMSGSSSPGGTGRSSSGGSSSNRSGSGPSQNAVSR